MRKILFILFAALVFVACNKEEVSYVKCELMPEILTLPAEKETTFTVRASVPAFIFTCAYESSDDPITNFAYSLRSFIPSSYPYVYDSKKHPLLDGVTRWEMFRDVYCIEQVDETTFKFTVKPPKGYDRIEFLFIPEGGLKYSNNLYVIII